MFQLKSGQAPRIDGNATGRSSERYTRHRGLPRHPHGHLPDVVDGESRAEANAALGGTAGDVVVHPVAGEYVDLAVFPLDGEVDRQLAFGLAEHFAGRVVQLDDAGGTVELFL